MALENMEYISDFVITNPVRSTDDPAFAADHMQGIKKACKQSFPNIDGAVSASDEELSYVTGVTSAIQTQLGTKLATADLLTQILAVDGPNTGINADLLDNQHGSYYAPLTSIKLLGAGSYYNNDEQTPGTTAWTSVKQFSYSKQSATSTLFVFGSMAVSTTDSTPADGLVGSVGVDVDGTLAVLGQGNVAHNNTAVWDTIGGVYGFTGLGSGTRLITISGLVNAGLKVKQKSMLVLEIEV